MSAAHSGFTSRLRKIDKRNRRLAEGWKPRLNRNGLITLEPARRVRLPLFTPLFVLAGFFVFKGYLLAALGAPAYAEKIALLGAGTFVERAGAWTMQVDPLTGWVAQLLAPAVG